MPADLRARADVVAITAVLRVAKKIHTASAATDLPVRTALSTLATGADSISAGNTTTSAVLGVIFQVYASSRA